MAPEVEPLTMYGTDAALPQLDWSWARERLVDAPIYWVSAAGATLPHPRPVWGVWRDDDVLALSIGTPANRRRLESGSEAVVHLESGLDVVIVEGRGAGVNGDTDGDAVSTYNAKYEWDYDVEQYGPLTLVAPDAVLAWRSAGYAGRDGFVAASRFRFS
jgi:hypothetical protein